jgi:hypothetical protein
LCYNLHLRFLGSRSGTHPVKLLGLYKTRLFEKMEEREGPCDLLVEGTMSSGKDYSRREFMTKPLVYLASAGLLSASGKLWGAETLLTENAPNPGK